MQVDNTVASASFMADDGVSFHGAIGESGRVVLDVEDPLGEADNTVRLFVDDLDQLAGLLQELRANHSTASDSHGLNGGELRASA